MFSIVFSNVPPARIFSNVSFAAPSRLKVISVSLKPASAAAVSSASTLPFEKKLIDTPRASPSRSMPTRCLLRSGSPMP